MFNLNIAQFTLNAISNILKPSFVPQEETSNQQNFAYLGDLVMNTKTGIVASFEAICDDPYYIGDNPPPVLFVVGFNPLLGSNFSDHWRPEDVEVFSRGQLGKQEVS